MYGAFAAVSTVNAVMLVTVLKAPQVLHGGTASSTPANDATETDKTK